MAAEARSEPAAGVGSATGLDAAPRRVGAPGLWLVLDVRATSCVAATVQDDRVIDRRRVALAGKDDVAALAEAARVLRQRAPGEVRGLGGIWHPYGPLGRADSATFAGTLTQVEDRLGLPHAWLPAGAALALGEWLRAPCAGPLAVLAIARHVEGGLVQAGQPVQALHFDPGHWQVSAHGPPCACGQRGCLAAYCGEEILQAWAQEADFGARAPLGDDWQSDKDQPLAAYLHGLASMWGWPTARGGWAIGSLARQLGRAWGVQELRVRTRHPAAWQAYQAAAQAAAGSPAVCVVTSAAPGEDAWFAGAAAFAANPDLRVTSAA